MSRKSDDMRFLHDLMAKMDARLDDLAEISARHDENLKEHMKRSLANEKAVDMLAQELKPVQDHVRSVNAIIKFISIVGAIIVFLITVWQGLQS